MTASAFCSAPHNAQPSIDGGLKDDYLTFDIARSSDRVGSVVGVQPRLGVLPIGNDRCDSDYLDHHDGARTLLNLVRSCKK